MVFILGGPALFVLSWAIIKAFAVESENLDGVSPTHKSIIMKKLLYGNTILLTEKG